jgi:hypothetical protein
MVDTLTTFEDAALEARRRKIEEGIAHYEQRCTDLKGELETAQKTLTVLRREHDNVILAQKLKIGDVVRVVCPACKGSGFSPDDVTSGRVRGSAFEGTLGSTPQLQDKRDLCKECSGNRYIVLERFKG